MKDLAEVTHQKRSRPRREPRPTDFRLGGGWCPQSLDGSRGRAGTDGRDACWEQRSRGKNMCDTGWERSGSILKLEGIWLWLVCD